MMIVGVARAPWLAAPIGSGERSLLDAPSIAAIATECLGLLCSAVGSGETGTGSELTLGPWMARLPGREILTGPSRRGGRTGLALAQARARVVLERGGVGRSNWRARAETIHRAFVGRNLSPGGSAHLLATAPFVDALDGCAPADGGRGP